MSVADVPQWLLAAGGVAGVSGGAIAVFQSRATRRRLNAEAEKLTSDAELALTQRASTVNAMALSLLEPMERRIAELTAEVARLQREVHSVTDRLKLAHALLDQHGIAFSPHPDPRENRDVHDRGP